MKTAALVAIAVAALVAPSAAQCNPNSIEVSTGRCQCNAGYACSNTSTWGCIDPTGGGMNFRYYAAGDFAADCDAVGSYCYAPTSRDDLYASFRASCTTPSYRYLQGDYCNVGVISGGWESKCRSSSCAVSGPQCYLENEDLSDAIAAWVIIVIICFVCCCIIAPIGICFFMGFACFAAGQQNQNARNNNGSSTMPSGTANTLANIPAPPPAYPDNK